MGNYYFVVSAFPPIALGAKPEMSYEEARQMVALNLNAHDRRQVMLLQRIIDIRNIRALWLGLPVDSRGNYTENELDEVLLIKDRLSPSMVDFLDRYDTQEERLRYFSSLVALLDQETIPHLSGFLLKYFQMEREIRLSLTALRAKEYQRDLLHEFQFEDPEDPFVAQLLAQKDEKETVIPEEYGDLKRAFLENISEPRKLYRAILQIRLSRIDELEDSDPFGIDHVLGYLARLIIVENWVRFDEKQGREVIDQICQ